MDRTTRSARKVEKREKYSPGPSTSSSSHANPSTSYSDHRNISRTVLELEYTMLKMREVICTIPVANRDYQRGSNQLTSLMMKKGLLPNKKGKTTNGSYQARCALHIAIIEPDRLRSLVMETVKEKLKAVPRKQDLSKLELLSIFNPKGLETFLRKLTVSSKDTIKDFEKKVTALVEKQDQKERVLSSHRCAISMRNLRASRKLNSAKNSMSSTHKKIGGRMDRSCRDSKKNAVKTEVDHVKEEEDDQDMMIEERTEEAVKMGNNMEGEWELLEDIKPELITAIHTVPPPETMLASGIIDEPFIKREEEDPSSDSLPTFTPKSSSTPLNPYPASIDSDSHVLLEKLMTSIKQPVHRVRFAADFVKFTSDAAHKYCDEVPEEFRRI